MKDNIIPIDFVLVRKNNYLSRWKAVVLSPLLWRAHLKVLGWLMYIVHDISIFEKINKSEISYIHSAHWCFMSRSWKKIGNCSILLSMLLYPAPLCTLALVGRVWEKIQATTGLIFFLVLVLAYMRVVLFFWIS